MENNEAETFNDDYIFPDIQEEELQQGLATVVDLRIHHYPDSQRLGNIYINSTKYERRILNP